MSSFNQSSHPKARPRSKLWITPRVGHSGTSVTELVYRHQIRPVIQTGAVAMDALFGGAGTGA